MNKNIKTLIEKADKEYKPIPIFKDWPQATSYEASLREQNKRISELKEQIGEEELERGLGFVRRIAAIDTGAIEGLYEVDRGITFTVAQETAILSAEVSERYQDFKAYYESQLKTYDMVLDFATNSVPINEAYIRELHREICEPQKTYKARIMLNETEKVIEKDLKHGQYKDEPNHVRLSNDKIHSYAPVHGTKPEMEKLIRELNTEEFQNANPVAQASYAHYAFVSIHPFSDGNGRVARALSSIFTYRSCNVPFLILVEDKLEYYNALSDSDNAKYETFIKFTYDRIIDAINLVIDSFRLAPKKSIDEYVSDIESLYTTGGYTYDQVDNAGHALLDLIIQQINRKLEKYAGNESLRISCGKDSGAGYPTPSNGMRSPVKDPGVRCILSGNTNAPANASFILYLYVDVPIDADKNDMVIIREPGLNHNLTARLSDLIPKTSTRIRQRVEWYVDYILEYFLERLSKAARQKLIDSGYRKV